MGEKLPELEDRVGLGKADLLPGFLCIHSLWLWVVELILLIQNFLIMTSSDSKGQKPEKELIVYRSMEAEQTSSMHVESPHRGSQCHGGLLHLSGQRGSEGTVLEARGRDFLQRERFIRGKGTI